ncbi:MAG: hypothetical protein EXQ55_03195 [Acidobacteria bacterium]|nr:hypothetical protein [Acidobacteriota bacterium]
MPHAKSLLAPLLWTAYILLPAAGWGVFHGAPVGICGAVALFAIWWIWMFGGSLPGRVMLMALLLIKPITGSLLLIDRGMEADYFANAQWAPPAERSTDYPGRTFTRIDRRLEFGAPGSPDLPLYFFNDSTRFNFYQPGEPDRGKLPFSATWNGYVWSRAAEDRRTFYLRGKGVTAELWVDGAQAVRLEPPAEEALDRARWPAGMRRLTVRVSSQSGGGRRFEAGFVDAKGTKTPFSQSELTTRAFAPRRIIIDRTGRFLGVAIDAVLIAMLVYCAGMTLFSAGMRLRRPQRRDAFVALSWLAAMIGGLLFAEPAVHRFIAIEGGQDYLTYESYARDIVLNGPLMLLGRPIGQAAPFYMQPLYAYFIALVHLVFGEDLSGLYLVQWTLAGTTVLIIWKVTERLFGDRTGKVALVLAGMFFAAQLVPLAGFLLSENLFIPLLAGWVLLMIKMASPVTADSESTTAGAGIAGGVATLTRSTLLAGWVFALPILVWARRRTGKGGGAVAMMLAVMVASVALATALNWIAARVFVPVASSFSIDFFQGNLPPKGVDLGPRQEYAGQVLQFAWHMPSAFLQNLARKVLYSLGFFSVLVPNAGTAPGLIATWWAALIGFGVLLWGRVPEGLRGPARAVPAMLSLSHFAAVTIIFPQSTRFTILPLYILLLPYAALGMVRAVDFLVPPEEE